MTRSLPRKFWVSRSGFLARTSGNSYFQSSWGTVVYQISKVKARLCYTTNISQIWMVWYNKGLVLPWAWVTSQSYFYFKGDSETYQPIGLWVPHIEGLHLINLCLPMVPGIGHNAPACSETEEEIPIWPIHTLTSIYWDPAVCAKSFPDSSVGKESTCNAGDPSLIPELGRPAGERIGYPLQYSWASLWRS